MILEAYGLRLSRLREEDIELVRHWRNSEKIRQHMHYRGLITSEMQKKWFSSIDNISNYFFILQHGESKIGLVNLSKVNYDKDDAEAGIFIWDDDFLGKGAPVKALLILMNFGYYCLGLKLLYGLVLRDNVRAINLYKKIGAVVTDKINEQQVMIEVTREGFESKTAEWETSGLFESLKNEKTKIIVEQQDHDENLVGAFLKSNDKFSEAFQKRY